MASPARTRGKDLKDVLEVNHQLHKQLRLATETVKDFNQVKGDNLRLNEVLSVKNEMIAKLEASLENLKNDYRLLKSEQRSIIQELQDRDILLEDTRRRVLNERKRNAALQNDLSDTQSLIKDLQSKLHDSNSVQHKTKDQLDQLITIYRGASAYEGQDGSIKVDHVLANPISPGISLYDASVVNQIATKSQQISDEYTNRMTAADRIRNFNKNKSELFQGNNPSGSSLQSHKHQQLINFDNPFEIESQGNAFATPAGGCFHATTEEVWQRTPLAESTAFLPPSSLPASVNEAVVRTLKAGNSASLFRNAVLRGKGPLYSLDDEHSGPLEVFFELLTGDAQEVISRAANGLSMRSFADIRAPEDSLEVHFELHIRNSSRLPVQQVTIETYPSTINSQSVDIAFETLKAGPDSLLRPGGILVRKGKMKIAQPFDETPVAMISFLHADNQVRKLALRLPISVSAFIRPLKLNSNAFFKLWTSQDFEAGELSTVIRLRPTFSQIGGFMLLSKCIQLGGALENMPGLDFGSNNVVCAGTMRRSAVSAASSKLLAVESVLTKEFAILIRAEKGRSENFKNCIRLSIRSNSFVLSRAVIACLVELLSEFASMNELKDKENEMFATNVLQRYQQSSTPSTMQIFSKAPYYPIESQQSMQKTLNLQQQNYFQEESKQHQQSIMNTSISPIRSTQSASLLTPGNMIQQNSQLTNPGVNVHSKDSNGSLWVNNNILDKRIKPVASTSNSKFVDDGSTPPIIRTGLTYAAAAADAASAPPVLATHSILRAVEEEDPFVSTAMAQISSRKKLDQPAVR